MSNRSRSSADQITRDYFDSLLIELRHIGNIVPDTTFELFGETFDTPIMMAALSHLDSCCEHGMAEMAKGAKLAGAVNWAGMGDNAELEEICETGARTIKIIKPYANSDEIFSRIECAEKCGCLAVGMDIDHAFGWNGEPDCILGLQMEPKSRHQLREYIEATSLPFVVKGVLSVRDALTCAEIGADAIVVSHHHGMLPYAVPPLMALPEIVDAVKGQLSIFVDCGIESGFDAFKALALGADAVCAGRVIMDPLRESKAEGVRKQIISMNDHLKGAMARTGVSDLGSFTSDVIKHRRF